MVGLHTNLLPFIAVRLLSIALVFGLVAVGAAQAGEKVQIPDELRGAFSAVNPDTAGNQRLVLEAYLESHHLSREDPLRMVIVERQSVLDMVGKDYVKASFDMKDTLPLKPLGSPARLQTYRELLTAMRLAGKLDDFAKTYAEFTKETFPDIAAPDYLQITDLAADTLQMSEKHQDAASGAYSTEVKTLLTRAKSGDYGALKALYALEMSLRNQRFDKTRVELVSGIYAIREQMPEAVDFEIRRYIEGLSSQQTKGQILANKYSGKSLELPYAYEWEALRNFLAGDYKKSLEFADAGLNTKTVDRLLDEAAQSAVKDALVKQAIDASLALGQTDKAKAYLSQLSKPLDPGDYRLNRINGNDLPKSFGQTRPAGPKEGKGDDRKGDDRKGDGTLLEVTSASIVIAGAAVWWMVRRKKATQKS